MRKMTKFNKKRVTFMLTGTLALAGAISSIPGESVQVNMAWIVNEKDIKNLYLNLNGTGGCYEITENMCHTGVVYVGKE